MGTPSYMAPEQAEGQAGIGPPADVWALGVIFYRLLTGKAPFESSSLVALLHQVNVWKQELALHELTQLFFDFTGVSQYQVNTPAVFATGQKSWFPTESFFTGNTSTYRPNDPVVGTCTFSAGSGGLEGEFAGFGSFLTGIFIARYQ